MGITMAAKKTAKTTEAAATEVKATAPVKKSPSKAAAPVETKPAAKKASPKAAPKAAAEPKTEAEATNGLTKVQTRILEFIKANPGCSRPEIKDGTGMHGGLSKIMGAPTKGVAENTLEGMGYITSGKEESVRAMVYHITAEGIKALSGK